MDTDRVLIDREKGLRMSTRDDVPAADDGNNTGTVSQNPEKDPADWVTGDEPATGRRVACLHTLSQQASESVPDELTKADASRMIEDLQAKTGRG